ncbi:hypothetical protein [Nostoc sp. 'Peltigera membranacea cyanobiont' 232]|uniref:hypothetical protein n=1 Tax=Nostoc sp. 'Peltigera membranacea cyanobiont' 232 TaxID=2014531 RepID=UPI00167B02E4|nr:hypothetical protein [Nostoc sp. 'Peltigera membranacea cyanobiont' 232]
MNLNSNLKDIPPNSPRRQILKTALTFVTGLSTTSLVRVSASQTLLTSGLT